MHFSPVSIHLAYSARVMGNSPEPKKMRSGGSLASTTLSIGGPVAAISPGVPFRRAGVFKPSESVPRINEDVPISNRTPVAKHAPCLIVARRRLVVGKGNLRDDGRA